MVSQCTSTMSLIRVYINHARLHTITIQIKIQNIVRKLFIPRKEMNVWDKMHQALVLQNYPSLFNQLKSFSSFLIFIICSNLSVPSNCWKSFSKIKNSKTTTTMCALKRLWQSFRMKRLCWKISHLKDPLLLLSQISLLTKKL